MAEKSKNISNSCIKQLFEIKDIRRGRKYVRDYYSGMNAAMPILPMDVIAWITTHDLSREGNKFHPRFVLKMPLNGDNISCVDGQLFHLTPGRALLLFPFQIHSNYPAFEANRISDVLVITFALPDSRGQEMLQGLRNRILDLNDTILKKLQAVLLAYQKYPDSSFSDAVFLLGSVLSELAECTPEPSITRHPITQLAEICEYMKENFQSDLNIKTLTAHFAMTPSTLLRLFKRGFGPEITPSHFLEGIRIQKAYEKLLYTDFSVSRIAESCGYRDPFAFSRAFRRITGCSPRKYRDNFHKKSDSPIKNR